MAEEGWQSVAGWEGWYEVSDRGRVRRVVGGRGTRPGRILNEFSDAKGYRRVRLSGPRKNHVAVHKLVLEAFVGPCEPGYECNHKDGRKGNNCLVNLEWVTPKGNVEHAIRTGLSDPSRAGERNGRAKLTKEQAEQIRKLRGVMRQREIAARFGVSRSMVSWIHCGHRWVQ